MTILLIDAGHGPNTPGKRSPDGLLREFTFNAAVANLTKQHLIAKGITVRFAHDKTRDVPLTERTTYANRQQVAAFISIHANAYGNTWNAAQGIETYIYPTAGTQTQLLANLLHTSLLTACNRKDRGIKKANFAVLRETTMPAVLLECGFMTNREEAQLLLDPKYQQQCANAIAFGVLAWLYRLDKG
ncbi:N-acetylmuramoyl-L-alanine amidase [Sporosarcina saromensis]|uniref:N-acetylmuramoyl-L-alanine amidase n=1 Tax=Sporosarcina saromensis TaxID=359365 RepID=A0ABU4GG64_9BACL|nr:N-acetylmuramoyl-L-alanine amidase [Sporosarcina saromensis]MDW0115285.1 N-acetylmuramoyl-L-alanine amidase [Sporosarcina saromensis]